MSSKPPVFSKIGVDLVEALLLKFPEGTDTRQLAKLSGYAVVSAAKALNVLAGLGRASHLRSSQGQCTWYHIKHRTSMIERKATNAKNRTAATQSKVRVEERYARFLSFEDAPVHRLISANSAEPLRPAGPASRPW